MIVCNPHSAVYPPLSPPCGGGGLIPPTAGAVPCAGPKEMFDHFPINRMYGECQL